MCLGKLLVTFSLLIAFPTSVVADVSISVSAAAAKSNLSTQIGANYDHQFPQSPISLSFGLNSGSYRSRATYVEEVGESTVSGSEFSGTFGVGVFEKFFIDIRSGAGNVNNSSILISEFSISPRINWHDFSFGIGLDSQSFKQNKPYFVLTRDLQPELKYKKTTHTVRFGYQFNDSIGISFSHSKMTYDRDMESALVLLSGPFLATANGIDMLSQLNGLLQSVAEMNLNYLASEKIELEFSIGHTQDFYDPKTVANDARIGMLVYQTPNFNWGLGLTSGKSEMETEPSRSLDAILVYAF